MNKILPIIFVSIVLCAADAYAQCTGPIVSVPYFMGFEGAEATSCIMIEDVNGGSNSGWEINNVFPTATGQGSIVYTYDTVFPGDDWFYTPGLNLSAGTNYRLNFLYRGGLGVMGLLENLEVRYGMSPMATAMSDPLFIAENIDTSFDSDFTNVSVEFSPMTSGVYYIGFHSFSEPDQGYIQVDDISVTVSLSVGDFGSGALVSYPNPVIDILHIDYPETITGAVVYNLLGQRVKASISNNQIDMSALSPGTYIVKIMANGTTASVKVSKQ